MEKLRHFTAAGEVKAIEVSHGTPRAVRTHTYTVEGETKSLGIPTYCSFHLPLS